MWQENKEKETVTRLKYEVQSQTHAQKKVIVNPCFLTGKKTRNKQRKPTHSPHTEVLSHFLPAGPHDGLVLADAQLLAVHQAGAFGPWLVLVVGVFFQVLLAEPSLLLVVRLLLQVGHGFPAWACTHRACIVRHGCVFGKNKIKKGRWGVSKESFCLREETCKTVKCDHRARRRITAQRWTIMKSCHRCRCTVSAAEIMLDVSPGKRTHRALKEVNEGSSGDDRYSSQLMRTSLNLLSSLSSVSACSISALHVCVGVILSMSSPCVFHIWSEFALDYCMFNG